jgi:hypothetical protein
MSEGLFLHDALSLKYTVTEEIGRGSFATVYKAYIKVVIQGTLLFLTKGLTLLLQNRIHSHREVMWPLNPLVWQICPRSYWKAWKLKYLFSRS